MVSQVCNGLHSAAFGPQQNKRQNAFNLCNSTEVALQKVREQYITTQEATVRRPRMILSGTQ
jgi:hypothetical protein